MGPKLGSTVEIGAQTTHADNNEQYTEEYVEDGILQLEAMLNETEELAIA